MLQNLVITAELKTSLCEDKQVQEYSDIKLHRANNRKQQEKKSWIAFVQFEQIAILLVKKHY